MAARSSGDLGAPILSGLAENELVDSNPRKNPASASDIFDKARRERSKSLIVPREHGAWGLLLVPIVTAIGVALRESNHIVPALLLLVTALALFWARTPVESLLGTSALRAQTPDERRAMMYAIAAIGGVAVVAGGSLVWAGRNPALWPIAIAAGLAFVIQALLKKQRSTRMLSEIVGTIGLTASAPAAYYVITGKFGATAWMLWVANFIFAGNQIHYVQVRIHTARAQNAREKFARGWKFALGQIPMAALLIAACALHFMPWLALIAFVPLLLRGWIYFAQKPAPLVVRQLGWSELRQAIVFSILFVGAFAR